MSSTSTPAAFRALGIALREWAAVGVGVVRVLERHGFGTVEPGQLLAVNAGGELAGQVYLGALDPVAVPLATESIGSSGIRSAHVAEGPAVAAGLACGGGATLLGHPLSEAAATTLGGALAGGRPAALVTTVDGSRHLVLAGPELDEVVGGLGGPGPDDAADVAPDDAPDDAAVDLVDDAAVDAAVDSVDDAVAAAVRRLLRRGATTTERITEGGLELLVDLWVPVPTVLVVGSGAIGEALLAQAALLGWAGERVTAPAEARARVAGFTEADVLVLLDHGPAFDAVLADGVRGGRGFIGALGSRHTQSARRERLTAAGLSEVELGRLHGPVGLDLGARTPAETAVSIVAEVVAERSGRAGSPLAAARGRIGS